MRESLEIVSFAHAKYGADPKEKHLLRDQLTFLRFLKKLFGAFGVKSPHDAAITYSCHLHHKPVAMPA